MCGHWCPYLYNDHIQKPNMAKATCDDSSWLHQPVFIIKMRSSRRHSKQQEWANHLIKWEHHFHPVVNFFPKHPKELVGGFSPFEKYESNWIISPIFGLKIKIFELPPPSFLRDNTWNHPPSFPPKGKNICQVSDWSKYQRHPPNRLYWLTMLQSCPNLHQPTPVMDAARFWFQSTLHPLKTTKIYGWKMKFFFKLIPFQETFVIFIFFVVGGWGKWGKLSLASASFGGLPGHSLLYHHLHNCQP